MLDMEHSGVGIETIKQQVAYARGLDIEVWVRPPEKSYAAVATVLDAGATASWCRCWRAPEEAHELVEWAKYRPEGKRGCAFGIRTTPIVASIQSATWPRPTSASPCCR